MKVINPLKDRIAEGELIAPPKYVTLEYHLNVTVMYVALSAGIIYNLAISASLNPAIFLFLPLSVWMFFILRRFRRYYEGRLAAWTSVGSGT